jgi:hypothetical protein
MSASELGGQGTANKKDTFRQYATVWNTPADLHALML